MRLLHLIPTLTGGGAERQLAYLTRELLRRGHEVLIAYVNDGWAPWVAEGLPVRKLRSQLGILGLIRSWRPDVLTTWYVESDIIGGLAAWLTRTPWVMREPSTPPLYTGVIKTFLRDMIGRRAAAIVANTPGGAAYWSARYIPNAIPLSEIDAAPRADLGPPPVVLYAGRLITMKNVDVLIDAAARLDDVTLVICGTGPRRRDLERRAGPRVRFTGHVREVWSMMKGADVFVSLSDFEGGLNSVREAFATGTPAVLSDIAAHRACADDASALFVPLRDPAATAAAIRRALNDRAEAAERARNARKLVESTTIEAMADGYEEVYRELRGRRRGGEC